MYVLCSTQQPQEIAKIENLGKKMDRLYNLTRRLGVKNYHDAPIAGTIWQVCYLHSSICDSLISNRLLQVSWTSGIVNKPRALRNFVHDLLEKSRNAQILEKSMVTGMIM
jgi:hypothetical protein